jgi:hypothetical protein
MPHTIDPSTARPGDVIRYRAGCVLEPLVCVVHRRAGQHLLLCDGHRILACDVLAVLRRDRPMPAPSRIAAAMRDGYVA